MSSSKKVITVSDIKKAQAQENKDVIEASRILGRERTENLAQLLNTEFIISNIETREINLKGNQTTMYIVSVLNDNGTITKYHTFSNVLGQQLLELKKYTDNGKYIRATLRRNKRYYYLE